MGFGCLVSTFETFSTLDGLETCLDDNVFLVTTSRHPVEECLIRQFGKESNSDHNQWLTKWSHRTLNVLVEMWYLHDTTI